MEKKFLILGASGQLGSEFQQVFLQRNIEFHAPDEKAANILDHGSIRELIGKIRPDVIINCAAYNAVDDAENNPGLAYEVNAQAVEMLARLGRDEGIFLVHYSSDYVFNGRKDDFYYEEDDPDPLNVYGKSKLAGEKAVLENHSEALVFRLSWVIGKGQQNFLYKLSQWSQKNRVLKISADETSVPTFTDEIVEITLLSLEKKLRGLYHLTNNDYASRYELARYFLKITNRQNLVVPVPASFFHTLAERPVFSAMSSLKIADELGVRITDWREGVDRYSKYFT